MPYKDPKVALAFRKKYYQIHKEEKKKYATRYYRDNYERLKPKRIAWVKRNKDKLKKWRKIYAVNYKKRKKIEEKARWTLHNAIRYKKIERPSVCSECKYNGLIHAHHEDYNKPLQVEWLCHRCHFKKHRKT